MQKLKFEPAFKDEPRKNPIKIDEKNLKNGLLGLVIALAEIIQEALKRQAIKRMENGRLTEEEIERLGLALMELEQSLEKIKRENQLEEIVNPIRAQLDNVVNETLNKAFLKVD